MSEKEDIVEILLAIGAPKLEIDKILSRPLHHAIERKSSVDVIKRLLLNGASVTSFACSYMLYSGVVLCTPLHVAVGQNNVDVVRLLLESNASANKKTKATCSKGNCSCYGSNGKTALHHAAECQSDPEIIRLLLKHGASIEKLSESKSKLTVK